MTLETVQEALRCAIEAAEKLGLDVAEAQGVARTIEERQGYPSDLYVLGLVGGTGVGKSTLLNSIAGADVSAAGARRPTTRSPVALLPSGYQDQATALLDWLGGAEVRTWAGEGAAVAIVDLPDLDSIEPAHAARVDAVLPKIDAVLWVTDPEKYDDAILHDHYLRRWMPRLARQAVVVNKADRLAPEDMMRVCDDLRRRLREEALPEVPVLSLSAVADIEPLRRWLTEGASVKALVFKRLRRSAVDVALELAITADVRGKVAPEPLVRTAAQADAAAVARDAILDIIGPLGLRAQSAAVMRTEAGGGPVHRARVLLEGGLGVTAKRADPEGYLLRWRERGSLDRVVAPIRHILLEAADALPARLRPSVLATADPAVIGEQLAHGIDGAVSGPAVAGDRPPSGPWPAIRPLQFLAVGSLLVGIVWLVALLAIGGSVSTGTINFPVLGPMPTPVVLIVGGLLGWFLLNRLLRRQADQLGRQWADSILEDVSRRVSAVVTDVLAAQLASVDEAQHALWAAVRDIEQSSADARDADLARPRPEH